MKRRLAAGLTLLLLGQLATVMPPPVAATDSTMTIPIIYRSASRVDDSGGATLVPSSAKSVPALTGLPLALDGLSLTPGGESATTSASSLGPSPVYSRLYRTGLRDNSSGPTGCARPCQVTPDSWVAVSPAWVVQMVDRRVQIADRNGVVKKSIDESSFFGEESYQEGGLGRVAYDKAHDRWVAIETSYDCSAGYLRLAVSKGNDPRQGWWVYALRYPGRLMDAPGLGISTGKIVLSANQFAIDPNGCTIVGYLGASLHVADWSEAMAGASDLSVAETIPEDNLFSWQPAMNQSPKGKVQAVVQIIPGGGAAFHLGFGTITGSAAAGTVAVSGPTDLTVTDFASTFVDPPKAQQPGSPTRVPLLDARPVQAIFWKGSLWFASNQGCVPDGATGTRACVRVGEIRPGTKSVQQDFLIGQQGTDTFAPVIGISGNGHLHVGFNRSSTSMPISSFLATRAPSDPLDSIHDPALLVPASGTFAGFAWSNFGGLSADPTSGAAIWVALPYVDPSGGWATSVQRITYTSSSASGGKVLIDGGATYTNQPMVALAITPPFGAPATVMRISNKPGTTGGELTYGATFPLDGSIAKWSLTASATGGSWKNGNRRVYIQFGDGGASWTVPKSDLVVFDNVAPSVSDAVAHFRVGTRMTQTLFPGHIDWTASDATSGIDYYDVWVEALFTTTDMYVDADTYGGGIGITAYDRAGNLGGSHSGTGYLINRGPNQLAFSAAQWQAGSVTDGFWGSSTRYATEAGAWASGTGSAHDVALVGVVGPDQGEVNVYVDGVLDATVDTYAASQEARHVLWTYSWGDTASHTIMVEVVGTSGRPRVDIESITFEYNS